MSQESDKIKYPQKFLLTLMLISLIIGGLSGGVTGFLTASIFSGSLGEWLTNPLGINKLINLSGNETKQNLEQSLEAGELNVFDEESLTTRAVQKVTPSVVSIIITKELQSYYNYSGPSFPFDEFFGFPFDFNVPQPVPGPTEKREVGGGTGFIINSNGLFLPINM